MSDPKLVGLPQVWALALARRNTVDRRLWERKIQPGVIRPGRGSLIGVPFLSRLCGARGNGHLLAPGANRNPCALIAVPRGATLAVMKTHEQIDRRSLALARAVADAIDRDPSRAGLERARKTCGRWRLQSPSPAVVEWSRILELEWDEIRPLLLDPGEQGRRLRQSSPFCGVLSPRERWEIYRRFAHEPQAA